MILNGTRIESEVADLPVSPINFKEALGNPVQDLKVLYYPGDELFLEPGSKITYKVNPDLVISECLNNPAQKPQRVETCDAYISTTIGKRILAIERDLNSSNIELLDESRFANSRSSGTVIFANKIVVKGEIKTDCARFFL